MFTGTGGSEAPRKAILQVSLGLVNYSEYHGHLPYPSVRIASPAWSEESVPPDGTGRPTYSWRVELVSYLESWHGTWDPSLPWYDPTNKQLKVFSSFYAYGLPGPKDLSQTFPETNLVAIKGPGTAFGDGLTQPRALKDIPPRTILVVETRASGIPWPAPGDFDFSTMPRTINAPDGKGISSRTSGGFHVIFADGQVWFLSVRTPFETLEQFFTIANAEKHDREILLGPYALHQGP